MWMKGVFDRRRSVCRLADFWLRHFVVQILRRSIIPHMVLRRHPRFSTVTFILHSDF
jgi:hypothetical protein